MVAGGFIIHSLMKSLGAEPAMLAEATQRVASGDLNPAEGAEPAPSALMGSFVI